MFKEIKKVRDECPICEEEKDLLYGVKDETLTINKENIAVKSKAYYCPSGNHYFFNLEDDEERFQVAYREYRKRKGLLQPEEITKIRQKYGLSRRALGRLLGWGEITIQRYETGALQDFAHNSLLFCIKDLDFFKHIFEHRKKELLKRDRDRIERKLEELETKEKQLTLNFIFKQATAKSEYKQKEKGYFPWKDFQNEYIGKIGISLFKEKGKLSLAA